MAVSRKIIQCLDCNELKPHGSKGRCTICARRYYVAADPEKVKAQKVAYYLRHRERLTKQQADRYHQDIEAGRAAQRSKRNANPALYARFARESYDRNAEVIKAKARDYYRRNPHVAIQANGRRRARMRNTQEGYVNFEEVRQRSAGLCGICKQPVSFENIHYDHILPLCHGGPHVTDNLQVSHPTCNLRKGRKLS